MGSIDCTETSVINCNSTLRKLPTRRSYQNITILYRKPRRKKCMQIKTLEIKQIHITCSNSLPKSQQLTSEITATHFRNHSNSFPKSQQLVSEITATRFRNHSNSFPKSQQLISEITATHFRNHNNHSVLPEISQSLHAVQCKDHRQQHTIFSVVVKTASTGS
jgi:hypothetical protein